MTGIFSPKDLPMVLLVCIAFVSSFSGIMLLGAIRFQKGAAFQSIAAPAVFFICLAGGAFWSLDLIPEAFKIISKLTPVYWTMEALMGLTLGDSVALLPLLLLLSTGVVFSFIAEQHP
jgi:ABC-type polysaccharide/polyol phosphate export permease